MADVAWWPVLPESLVLLVAIAETDLAVLAPPQFFRRRGRRKYFCPLQKHQIAFADVVARERLLI